MRRLLTLIICCILIQPKVLANNCKPIVAVYPSWSHNDNALNTLPWHRFTHLAVFGIYPNAKGELDSQAADGFIGKLVSQAHSRGKKVFISIGGAGAASKNFRIIAADENLRSNFVSNVSAYLKTNQLDGVDIDWEYWTLQHELGKGGNDPIESKNLVKLLADLRKNMPKGILLTTDVAAGPWLGEQYRPEIKDSVDYINVMAFDFTGQWPESKIAHHADYSTFQKALDYFLKKGFTPEQILAGLPAYGKEFVGGKNERVNTLAYSEILKLLPQDSKKLQTGRINNTYFETPENVSKKSLWLKNKNFGGLFLFDVLSDSKDSSVSLLQTASEILNPGECYQ